MTIRVFSDEDLERLRSFPEINREELIRFFTLTPADVEFIDPGRGRGPSDRLGLAVQLCTLPWLGFVPDDVTSAPAVAVARLSERLQVSVGDLRPGRPPAPRPTAGRVGQATRGRRHGRFDPAGVAEQESDRGVGRGG